jgi:hypothetical protein
MRLLLLCRSSLIGGSARGFTNVRGGAPPMIPCDMDERQEVRQGISARPWPHQRPRQDVTPLITPGRILSAKCLISLTPSALSGHLQCTYPCPLGQTLFASEQTSSALFRRVFSVSNILSSDREQVIDHRRERGIQLE